MYIQLWIVNITFKCTVYNIFPLYNDSTCGLGEMPWPPLGHDGPQGPEGHQPVLHTYAYCGWWSKPMWVSSPAWTWSLFFKIRNYYVQTCFWLFLPCFGNIFIHCLLPGSVSSCDAFLNVFQSHGLKPEVICPCATSPEALTVAIRRYHICILACSDKRHSDTGVQNEATRVALHIILIIKSLKFSAS